MYRTLTFPSVIALHLLAVATPRLACGAWAVAVAAEIHTFPGRRPAKRSARRTARELVRLEIDAEDICGRWVAAVNNSSRRHRYPRRRRRGRSGARRALHVDRERPDPLVVELVQRLLRTPDRV